MYYPFPGMSTLFLHFFYDNFIILVRSAETLLFAGHEPAPGSVFLPLAQIEIRALRKAASAAVVFRRRRLVLLGL